LEDKDADLRENLAALGPGHSLIFAAFSNDRRLTAMPSSASSSHGRSSQTSPR
jgi:hypothetical protein